MIDWKKLGHLITLKEDLYLLYEVIKKEEIEKFQPIIQDLSDRLYERIRKEYNNYSIVVEKESREK